MKVGTDGVLLGAWCSLDHYPDTILDVGSGTGLIALMLAQRCDAMTIDAVEIDESAYEQTVENFEQSDWADRLFCYHSPFKEFAEEMAEEEEQYDLIISNPPFYTDEYETEDDARNKARFTSSLSFEELIKGANHLLSPSGKFVVVVPFKEEQLFVSLASKSKWFLNRVCRVKGTADTEIKRSLLEFSFQETELVEEELVIEISRHNYTERYKELTRDFYLKM
ncbi:tRNA1(Val) (adenine(37)-N6)-methyltransferase [Pseudotenacibaculum haliotis]|uniref:tRNA1(Val) (adenine(37)-N6)-methyltransferase n=1 Tax=Pseudotenacibaculum haliotis TaxID=1862138 RepID=A0ABW5LVD3_9FLAO